MKNETIEDSALRSLFWKEEILQVLYWMHGEGMGTEVNLPQMLPFLNTSYQNLEYHLHKITKEGLLLTLDKDGTCLLYTSPSPRDLSTSRMPSSA